MSGLHPSSMRPRLRADSGIPNSVLTVLALLAIGGGLYSGVKDFLGPERGRGFVEEDSGPPELDPTLAGLPPEIEAPPPARATGPPAYGWQAPGASLVGEDLSGRTFDQCALPDADLRDARLDDARFHECDLRGADFRGASLEGTFALDSCRLDGAKFDDEQLAILARGSFRLRGSTVDGQGPLAEPVELSALLLPHGRDLNARAQALRLALVGAAALAPEAGAQSETEGEAGGPIDLPGDLGLPAPEDVLGGAGAESAGEDGR